MKKFLALLLIVLGSRIANAQCPQTSCTDSLAYNVSKDTLIVSPGYSAISWAVAAGPGVVANNAISGLKPGATTVLILTAVQGNMTTYSIKTITVAPVPVVPRTVTGVSFTVAGGIHFTFSDGGTQ